MRKRIALAIIVLMGFVAGAAVAQDVKIQTPAPAREPRVVAPGLLYERRPGDENLYPGAPIVPYDPAFIRPFTIDIESRDATGRAGLSGWTAPNPPLGPSGAGLREINGWLGFGFTWTWGGPPPRPRSAGTSRDPSARSESP